MSRADFRFFAPIQKVDRSQRMVWGWASTTAVDSQGERIRLEALKKALPGYLEWRNIREMHRNSAVGVAREAAIVPKKGLYIGAKIVDRDAWEKVVEGVYRGFSIGGRRLMKIGNEITELEIDEISLVDRPANPECRIELAKAASAEKKDGSENTEASTDTRERITGSRAVAVAGARPEAAEEDEAKGAGDNPQAEAKDAQDAASEGPGDQADSLARMVEAVMAIGQGAMSADDDTRNEIVAQLTQLQQKLAELLAELKSDSESDDEMDDDADEDEDADLEDEDEDEDEDDDYSGAQFSDSDDEEAAVAQMRRVGELRKRAIAGAGRMSTERALQQFAASVARARALSEKADGYLKAATDFARQALGVPGRQAATKLNKKFKKSGDGYSHGAPGFFDAQARLAKVVSRLAERIERLEAQPSAGPLPASRVVAVAKRDDRGGEFLGARGAEPEPGSPDYALHLIRMAHRNGTVLPVSARYDRS